jgi:glycosyltransferase involved in cell wall biosynthesis
MEIKVTVIIPIYNMELYLAECLETVTNQTLREIEILCINDGSTDNSLQILDLRVESSIKKITLPYGFMVSLSYHT